MRASWAWLAVFLPALVAQAGGARLPQGDWGGESASVKVDEQGVRLEFDCAHGRVDGPFELDAQGRFDLQGTYTPEGGPTRQGGESRVPARYSGVVKDGVMRLKVEIGDGRSAPQDLALRAGQPANLRKCG